MFSRFLRLESRCFGEHNGVLRPSFPDDRFCIKFEDCPVNLLLLEKAVSYDLSEARIENRNSNNCLHILSDPYELGSAFGRLCYGEGTVLRIGESDVRNGTGLDRISQNRGYCRPDTIRLVPFEKSILDSVAQDLSFFALNFCSWQYEQLHMQYWTCFPHPLLT